MNIYIILTSCVALNTLFKIFFNCSTTKLWLLKTFCVFIFSLTHWKTAYKGAPFSCLGSYLDSILCETQWKASKPITPCFTFQLIPSYLSSGLWQTPWSWVETALPPFSHYLKAKNQFRTPCTDHSYMKNNIVHLTHHLFRATTSHLCSTINCWRKLIL